MEMRQNKINLKVGRLKSKKISILYATSALSPNLSPNSTVPIPNRTVRALNHITLDSTLVWSSDLGIL